jgi:hypothetical protein
LTLHLAPNSPLVWLWLATLAALGVAVWAYGFRQPPLSLNSRRVLALLRVAALAALVWLLALPVLERNLPASSTRVVVLRDRSLSMDRPSGETRANAASSPTRAEIAAQAVRELAAAFRGRAQIEVRDFAGALISDSTAGPAFGGYPGGSGRAATATGDALAELARLPVERRPDGVVIVSDGAVNAGQDPVAAAHALGVPVHALLVGGHTGVDRGIAGVEASTEARVGEATPVRVRVVSDEERGTPIEVKLTDGDRELAHATVLAPGPGAEVTAELKVVPARAGLALWTARVAPLENDLSPDDDTHGVAVPVAPGKLGVLVLSSGLNWDLTFLRRALLGDTTVDLDTRVRDASGNWRALERNRAALSAGDLTGRSVVVLDALSGIELGPVFDKALAAFVHGGGGLLLLSGPEPGAVRFARGALGNELTFMSGAAVGAQASPEPQPNASELLMWDDDQARGARAWHDAAPLSDVLPLAPGGADRVLIAARENANVPLWLARTVGRGQVLLVNGTGLWRWSLAGTDELAGERGRRLWRKTMRWLAEPVQGEPLRVTAERRLVPGGEPVRLDAILQDARFKAVSGAEVRGELNGPGGATRPITFTPGGPGAYTSIFPSPGPGRWQVSVRATRDGRELGRARGEFAVDRWTLEALNAQPDSAAMAAIAAASGGKFGKASGAAAWARGLDTRQLVRNRTASARLWESPWLFALVVGMLSAEWAWRRRRGLP